MEWLVDSEDGNVQSLRSFSFSFFLRPADGKALVKSRCWFIWSLTASLKLASLPLALNLADIGSQRMPTPHPLQDEIWASERCVHLGSCRGTSREVKADGIVSIWRLLTALTPLRAELA